MYDFNDDYGNYGYENLPYLHNLIFLSFQEGDYKQIDCTAQ